ncbi:MAG TPA: M55 family metallopeptidase [Candidatus Limnocylindrales bacterium]|nr:M55 family metallopeptidase [Candidatus Limnocylindrales bacterium]
MRIYLSVDMEGLAGVAHPHQVVFGLNGIDRTDYDRSRALMAGETNAAIEAAFEHGASEVVVNDSHWQMRNLRAEDLRAGARLIIGDKPFSMTQGIGRSGDGSFDAAAFIGYHAGAGHPTGVIAHTYSSATVLEIRANGVPHNEAGLNAIRLGHHGVPVMLVAGDDALATEVETLLPWAERVIVKRGLGTNVADSLAPEDAQRAIREGMERAIGRLGEMRLHEPAGPIAGEIDFRVPAMADYACVLPGIERIGPRTVGFSADDGEAWYRTCLVLTRLAAIPAA